MSLQEIKPVFTFLQHPAQDKHVSRPFVDAYLVLSLGAKVNNNKHRVGNVYTNWGGGKNIGSKGLSVK